MVDFLTSASQITENKARLAYPKKRIRLSKAQGLLNLPFARKKVMIGSIILSQCFCWPKEDNSWFSYALMYFW